MRALWLVLLAGCGGEPALRVDPETRGIEVASVNGEAIGIDEVRELSRATGLAPRAALRRLVDERLLAQRAEAGGYGERVSVRRELVRAAVRALLAEAVERAVPESDVTGRTARLAALLTELRRTTPVHFDEAGVRAALGDSQSR